MSYKNPNHVVYNGECCDTQFWCRRNQCENYFKFCVTALGSTNQCSLGSATTGVLGDDDFRFPGLGGSLGNGHTNPLTYSFTKWKVSLNIRVIRICDLVDLWVIKIKQSPWSFAHIIRRGHVNRAWNADHAARVCKQFVYSIVKITRFYGRHICLRNSRGALRYVDLFFLIVLYGFWLAG